MEDLSRNKDQVQMKDLNHNKDQMKDLNRNKNQMKDLNHNKNKVKDLLYNYNINQIRENQTQHKFLEQLKT